MSKNAKHKAYERHDYRPEKRIIHRANPLYCSVFGCGKRLTLRESLFSNKCINHNKANEKH